MDTLVVERNNVSLEFKPKKIQRGTKKGDEYPAPEVTKDNLKTVAEWLGAETLVSIINAELNKRSQVWTDESIPDEGKPEAGQFHPDWFIEMAKSFSARGEKLGDLEDKMEDLTTQITDLAGNMEDPTNMGKMQELVLELKNLRIAYASKKKEKKKKDENAPVAAAA